MEAVTEEHFYVAPYEAQYEAPSKPLLKPHTKMAAIGYLFVYLATLVAVYTFPPDVGASRMCVFLNPVVMLAALYGIECSVTARGNNLFAWLVAYFFLVMGALMLISAGTHAR